MCGEYLVTLFKGCCQFGDLGLEAGDQRTRFTVGQGQEKSRASEFPTVCAFLIGVVDPLSKYND